MPYEIKHVSKNKFQVINRVTGKIHSNGTTLDKAEKQVRLMEYIKMLRKNTKLEKIDLGEKNIKTKIYVYCK